MGLFCTERLNFGGVPIASRTMSPKQKDRNDGTSGTTSISQGLSFLITFLIAIFAFGAFWWSKGAAKGHGFGESDRSDSPRRVSGPVIVVDRYEHDFGTMLQGEEQRTAFTIRNDGTQNLSIGKVDKTCNCAYVKLERSVLPPGEISVLDVKLVAGINTGNFTYQVIVPSNDSKSPKTKLELNVAIRSSVETSPKTLNYGSVRRGESTIRPLRIRRPDGKPFKITSVKSNRKEFVVEAFDKEILASEHALRIAACPRDDTITVAGFAVGVLTVRTSLDERAPTRVQVVMKVE